MPGVGGPCTCPYELAGRSWCRKRFGHGGTKREFNTGPLGLDSGPAGLGPREAHSITPRWSPTPATSARSGANRASAGVLVNPDFIKNSGDFGTFRKGLIAA